MKLYFASRFSRLPELVRYREEIEHKSRLIGSPIAITSRWLNGGHEWVGTPDDEIPRAELARFAQEDLDDLIAADTVVCFTEPSRTGPARGGRHVEAGYALALGKPVICVGPIENVFYALPEVFVLDRWELACDHLLRCALTQQAVTR